MTSLNRRVIIAVVGVTSLVAGYYLSELLARFRRMHPGVQVFVTEETPPFLEHLLINGELDVAIINDPKPTPLIETRFILNEKLFLVGMAGSGLSLDRPLPLSVLKSRPLVLPSAPHAMRSTIETACALENITLPVDIAGRKPDQQWLDSVISWAPCWPSGATSGPARPAAARSSFMAAYVIWNRETSRSSWRR